MGEPIDTVTFELIGAPEDRARIPAMNDAFNHVVSGTTIPERWRAGLMVLWIQSILIDRGEYAFASLSPLCEFDWEWPAFDVYRQTFRHHDEWPAPWHHYKVAAKDLRRSMSRERVKLLVVTLRTALVSREAWSDDRCRELRDLGWTLHCESQVARPYVQDASAGVDVFDWRTWPPFYPGDESQLVVDRRQAAAPRFFGGPLR